MKEDDKMTTLMKDGKEVVALAAGGVEFYPMNENADGSISFNGQTYVKSYIGMKTTTDLANWIDNSGIPDPLKILAGAVVIKQEITDDDVELYLWCKGQGMSKDESQTISLKKNPQVLGILA